MTDEELYLHYADLKATTTSFTGLSDDLTAVKVAVPDTGTVNIFWPMWTISENVKKLAEKLDHVGAACTEVVAEVQGVDEQGRLSLKPMFGTLDNTGYVTQSPTPYQSPYLLPDPVLEVDGVLPPGPYPTPVPPEPEPDR